MNICAKCTHVRRGWAIPKPATQRPGPPGPPNPPNVAWIGSIFGAHEIAPGMINPQTGYQSPPSGRACRDLNPKGECTDFVKASLLTRFVRAVWS